MASMNQLNICSILTQTLHINVTGLPKREQFVEVLFLTIQNPMHLSQCIPRSEKKLCTFMN